MQHRVPAKGNPFAVRTPGKVVLRFVHVIQIGGGEQIAGTTRFQVAYPEEATVVDVGNLLAVRREGCIVHIGILFKQHRFLQECGGKKRRALLPGEPARS